MTFDAYENVLVALAVWREARGEPVEAKRAVFWVIRNRRLDPRKRWPQTVAGVVLQLAQFSSFLASDPNAVLFPRLDDPSWRACCDAVDHPGPDPTGGANHYRVDDALYHDRRGLFDEKVTAMAYVHGELAATAERTVRQIQMF